MPPLQALGMAESLQDRPSTGLSPGLSSSKAYCKTFSSYTWSTVQKGGSSIMSKNTPLFKSSWELMVDINPMSRPHPPVSILHFCLLFQRQHQYISWPVGNHRTISVSTKVQCHLRISNQNKASLEVTSNSSPEPGWLKNPTRDHAGFFTRSVTVKTIGLLSHTCIIICSTNSNSSPHGFSNGASIAFLQVYCPLHMNSKMEAFLAEALYFAKQKNYSLQTIPAHNLHQHDIMMKQQWKIVKNVGL